MIGRCLKGDELSGVVSIRTRSDETCRRNHHPKRRGQNEAKHARTDQDRALRAVHPGDGEEAQGLDGDLGVARRVLFGVGGMGLPLQVHTIV